MRRKIGERLSLCHTGISSTGDKRSYLSFVRAWKEFQRNRRYRIIIYIYIQLCYTYLITIFWEETLFWIKLNKTPFRTLSLFFANLRKLHEQLILVTLERKKEKKRSMFVMESIWGWYIHSSPVTNRSVKESKYTVRGIFWPAGLQTRLHGCYGGTYAPIVQGCIRVSILYPCNTCHVLEPCRVYICIYTLASRSIARCYRAIVIAWPQLYANLVHK